MTSILDKQSRRLYSRGHQSITEGTKVPKTIDLPALLARRSPSRNDMTVTLWITNMGVGAGAALTASMGYAVGIGLFAAIGAVAHLLRATR